jgi:drug/metabolite transporter (DMT)-like permease
MNLIKIESEAPRLNDLPVTNSIKNPPSKRIMLGIGAVALSGILFGVQGIMGKYAFAGGANVPTLLMLRFITASLIIWIPLCLMLAKKKEVDLRQPLPRGLALSGMGLFWITNSLFYFLALELLPASTNSLLVFTYPAIVAFWSVLFFKEKLSGIKATALALALGGCFLTVDPQAALAVSSSFSFLGALLALASAFSNSWYVVLAGRVGPNVSGIVKAAYSLPVTALLFTLYVLVTSTFSGGMSFMGWLLCVLIGVLTGFSIYLFLIGVNYIGGSRSAIISTTEPATALFMGAIILAEPVTPVKLVGGLCIIGAILLLSRTTKA